MRRREFVTFLGGAAAWPLATRAQQAGKVATVGFLGPGTVTNSGTAIAVLTQRLRELGWVEGRNITIERRWADGRRELFNPIAAAFVRLNVDVIVTTSTPGVLAA